MAVDSTFQARFIQLKANYASGTGQQVLEALLRDRDLAAANVSEPVNGRLLFKIDSAEGRRETFKSLLIEASVHVTNALVVSESAGLTPVSEDPYLCRLFCLRSGDSGYVGQRPQLSPYLGLAIAKSVLPDEALAQLEIKDLFDYRKKAGDAYVSWSAEIDRLASRISDIAPERINAEVPRIINTEVAPKLIEYRNEMKSARDNLFGDLIKKVATWEMPTLSLAYLASLDVTSAIAVFAGALAPAVPALVDFYTRRREVQRNNSMAYLVGVSAGQNDDR